MRELSIAEVTECCARHGLELIEFEAFYGPSHEIPLGLEDLARFISPNDFSWWAEQPPEKDYLAALHSLLGKELIQVPQKTLNRHVSEVGLPSHRLEAGTVCYPRLGRKVTNAIARDISKLRHPLLRDGGRVYYDSTDNSRRMTITCVKLKDCKKEAWSHSQASNPPWGIDDLTVSHCSLIRRIGPWHSSFYQGHRQGYQVDIFYRRQRILKLRDAQIDLTAKVTRREPLSITGTLRGFPFSFTEAVGNRPKIRCVKDVFKCDLTGDHNAWIYWSFTWGEQTVIDPTAQQHEGFPPSATRPWSDHLSPTQALKIIRRHVQQSI